MKGLLFVYGSMLFLCCSAIIRPWIGVVGYFGYAVAIPTFLWRWSVPPGGDYQKYIAGATFIGLVLSGFKGNTLKGTPAWSALCLVLYLAWAGLSALFTIHAGDTAFYMTNIWKMILMACVGLLLIDTPKKVTTLMWVLVVAQGYNAYEINLQYFQTGHSWAARNGWGYLDNNTYSILTIPVMGISLGLVFYSEKIWQRLLAGGIFILQLHQIMLMESRGCMLGGMVMLVIAVWYVDKNRWTTSTIIASFIMGSILAGPPVMKEFSSSFKPKDELDSSADSRFKLWKAGIEITRDNPIVGVGPNAARRVVPRYYEAGLSVDNKALHNLFFDISAGSGIPAAILYFAFFVLPWWKARQVWKRSGKQLDPWAKAALFSILCGIPGYIASSMFSSGALIESSYICVIVGTSALLVIDKQSRSLLTSHPLQASTAPL